MFVDMLLRLLGENVSQYQNNGDKWLDIFTDIWGYSTIYLSYIFAIIPWIWILWHKKRGGKITKKKIIITAIVSLLLVLLGFNLPWWIMEIIGGLAVRGMYGGQI